MFPIRYGDSTMFEPPKTHRPNPIEDATIDKIGNQRQMGAKTLLEELHLMHRARHNSGEARQGTDAFAPHRVALPGHGGGTDLLLLERFFHLAAVLEQPQVAAEFVSRLANAAERRQHLYDHL